MKHRLSVQTCMCSCVSLQVECVIEAFAAEGTEVALDIAVAFHVSVEKALQAESLLADLALELAVLLGLDGLHLVGLRPGRQVHGQRVLDPMTTVDQFQRGVNGNSELKISEFRIDISVFSIRG